MRSKGLLPGEKRKVGLVEVHRENVLDGTITVDGLERHTDIYVVEVRRLDLKWMPARVYKTSLLDTGEIPNEVLERINRYRDTIMAEQRRDRGQDQAERRKYEEDEDGIVNIGAAND